MSEDVVFQKFDIELDDKDLLCIEILCHFIRLDMDKSIEEQTPTTEVKTNNLYSLLEYLDRILESKREV